MMGNEQIANSIYESLIVQHSSDTVMQTGIVVERDTYYIRVQIIEANIDFAWVDIWMIAYVLGLSFPQYQARFS